MRAPSLLVVLLACAGCSAPPEPETERRPVPQATQLRDAIDAPLEHARGAQDAVDAAARERDAAVDAAGG